MTAGKKIQRLVIVVVVGLLTIAGQAQTKDSVLTISQNPFATQTVLTIPNLTNDTVSLKIYNPLGSIVADYFEDTIITGTVIKTFYADTLPNGFYFIRLTINLVDHSYKVVKDSSLYSDILTIENRLTVYPVPTSDKVYIKSSCKIMDIQIFDCNGQKVSEQKNDYNNGIDLTDLKKGFYLLHVVTKDKLFIEKVIKQ
jgi:hypothetical protein